MDESLTILSVAKESNLHHTLQRIFKGHDKYRLLTSESGEEALQVIQKQPEVQVIISSNRLPGISGLEFFSRSIETNPDTVRIVLSDITDTNAMLDAIDIGHIFKFVPEPWNEEELGAAITQAEEVARLKCRNKHLQLQLQQRNKELKEINANLERIVAQRTASLELRSNVLQTAQDILEQLPVGVIGLDSDNYIVLINSFALDLLNSDPPIILGDMADTHFGPNLLDFVKRVRLQENSEEYLRIGPQLIHATGAYLNGARDRGIFITLNRIQETNGSTS